MDDDADEREACRDFLSVAGFRVVVAESGEAAVKMAAELQPRIIVMDLSLPGIDGREATRRIRRHPQSQSIRILALTGNTSSDAWATALAAGCDGFLAKPCAPALMVERVRALLAEKL